MRGYRIKNKIEIFHFFFFSFFFVHLYLIVAYTMSKSHKYDVDKKVQIFTKYCKKEMDYKMPRDMKRRVKMDLEFAARLRFSHRV